MNKEKNTNIPKRTEEVQDIIDRMPGKTAMMVALFVIALAGLLLLAGWVIKYPESVKGSITLTTKRPPVRQVANVSGDLIMLKDISHESINKNEMFAVIESAGNPWHIQLIDSLISVY